MKSENTKAIDRRLARIEGQVRGLRRMLEEDAYCCDILTQISAVTSALQQVAGQVAAQHVKHCIVGHGSGSEHDAAKRMTQDELVDELTEVFGRLMKA
ncbi:MAG: metal-sensitive transcriptional regulator [Methanoregulaceae archaeon]|nr:metal-sensitive transcriptional regulator [Methanoregulaceae archaeon]